MNSTKNTISIIATAALLATPIAAADTIKVGVLHSLSGTLAISETTLKETMELLIEEQNKKGGILGKQLEAVVVDPASDWPLFAEKARELLTVEEVDVIFGGLGIELLPNIKNTINKTFITFKDLNQLI